MTQWKEEDPNNWCSLTTRYLDLRYWILQKFVYNDALFSAAVRVHRLFYEIIIEIMIGAGPWLNSLFHLCHFGGMIVCTISRIGDATTLLPIRRCCLKTEYVEIPTANALPARYFYSPIDHQISKKWYNPTKCVPFSLSTSLPSKASSLMVSSFNRRVAASTAWVIVLRTQASSHDKTFISAISCDEIVFNTVIKIHIYVRLFYITIVMFCAAGFGSNVLVTAIKSPIPSAAAFAFVIIW